MLGSADFMHSVSRRGRLSLSSASSSSSSSSSSTTSSFRQRAVGRMGRKSRPLSIVSSSSSLDSSGHNSCANRDTAGDECGMHRFIVWAAVRRNLSARISDHERRECPLLGCKQVLPDHERMLQHLYRCEYLSSGRYWCHECCREERFSDAKCRRCLDGNPSMRRKMMSKAKSFWQSLGNRPKSVIERATIMDGDILDFTGIVDEPPVGKAELPSDANEIFEIDSNEVWLGGYAVQAAEAGVGAPNQPSGGTWFFPAPDSDYQSSIMQWQTRRRPQDFVPEQAHVPPLTGFPPQPAADAVQQIQQNARLNKSSVRSTASAASTGSNISNFSTWSNVSGVSSVSTASAASAVPIIPAPSCWQEDGAWLQTASVDAAVVPGSVSPLMSQYNPVFDDIFATGVSLHTAKELAVISELPAEPMVDCSPCLPTSHEIPSDLAQFMTGPPLPLSLPLFPPLPTPDMGSDQQANRAEPATGLTDAVGVAPRALNSLLDAAWDGLREHVQSSVGLLKPLSSNPMASQIAKLSPESIAGAGLQALRFMLRAPGQMFLGPLDALCFVHVAFAFAFALDDRHARAQAGEMYRQALVYGDSFRQDVRQVYREICEHIWEPKNATRSSAQTWSMSPASRQKGKASCDQSPRDSHNTDALVAMARLFLDKLDYGVLSASAKRFNVDAGSPLVALDLIASDMAIYDDVSVAFSRASRALLQKYADHPSFSSAIEIILRPGSSKTVRRVELELLQLGLSHLPWRTFFEVYVPLIYNECDKLYEQLDTGTGSRLSHHIQALDVVTASIPGPEPARMADNSHSQTGSANAITALSFDLNLGLLGGPGGLGLDLPSIGTADDTPKLYIDTQQLPSLSPPEQDDSPMSDSLFTNVPSSPQHASGPSTPPTTEPTPGQAVEADDGCELCSYRPKGDPRWFKGSMAKHMKNQHGGEVKIFRCPYPGCESQYKNRLDNLKAHMQEKNHFVGGEAIAQRPPKRRRVEE